MHAVFLRLSSHKAQAALHMAGHKAWLQAGFDDGIFLLTGNLPEGAGGVILAHGISHADLQARVAKDPFVAAGVVSAELTDITVSRTDDRLRWLLP
jgi:uncharacterized protein YciI